jgi:ADP-ribose pyrophosphatase YjhB (NUDIX family)
MKKNNKEKIELKQQLIKEIKEEIVKETNGSIDLYIDYRDHLTNEQYNDIVRACLSNKNDLFIDIKNEKKSLNKFDELYIKSSIDRNVDIPKSWISKINQKIKKEIKTLVVQKIEKKIEGKERFVNSDISFNGIVEIEKIKEDIYSIFLCSKLYREMEMDIENQYRRSFLDILTSKEYMNVLIEEDIDQFKINVMPEEVVKNKVDNILLDIENEIFTENIDYFDDELELLVKNKCDNWDGLEEKLEKLKINWDIFQEDLVEELKDEISFDVNVKDLIKNSNQFLRLNGFISGQEWDKYNTEGNIDALSDIANIFNINTNDFLKEMINNGVISKKDYYDNPKKYEERFQKIENKENKVGVEAKDIMELIDSNTTNQGKFAFLVHYNLNSLVSDIMDKKISFASDNVDLKIPLNSSFNIIDTENGACGLADLEVKNDLIVKSEKLEFILDSDSEKMRYGFDKICGITNEFFGKNISKELSFVNNESIENEKNKEISIDLFKEIFEIKKYENQAGQLHSKKDNKIINLFINNNLYYGTTDDRSVFILTEKEMEEKFEIKEVKKEIKMLSNRYLFNNQKTTDMIVKIKSFETKEIEIPLIYRKFPPLGYSLPGGMVEKGETPKINMSKELLEEINLDVTQGKIKFLEKIEAKEVRGTIETSLYQVDIDTTKLNEKSLKAGDDALDIVFIKEGDLEVFLDTNKDIMVPHHLEMIKKYVLKQHKQENIVNKSKRVK